jgi:hypothetical protein
MRQWAWPVKPEEEEGSVRHVISIFITPTLGEAILIRENS